MASQGVYAPDLSRQEVGQIPNSCSVTLFRVSMWFRAVVDVVEEAVGGAKASVVEAARKMVARVLIVVMFRGR